MQYVFLMMAVLAETVATSTLKMTEEFSKPIPTLVVAIGYAVAFYCLTLTIRTLPVGITYALWSGLGVVFITLAGIFLYSQVPNSAAVLGMVLIVAGIAVIHLFGIAPSA